MFSFEEMKKVVKQQLHTAEDLRDLQSSVATQQKDHRLHDDKVWIRDTTTDTTVVGMSRGSVSTQQQMVCVQV